jgi:hypothetical protein
MEEILLLFFLLSSCAASEAVERIQQRSRRNSVGLGFDFERHSVQTVSSGGGERSGRDVELRII